MGARRIKPNIQSDRFDESRAFYEGVIGLEEQGGLDWILFFGSGPDQPGDRVGGLADLRGRGVTALSDGLCEAVAPGAHPAGREPLTAGPWSPGELGVAQEQDDADQPGRRFGLATLPGDPGGRGEQAEFFVVAHRGSGNAGAAGSSPMVNRPSGILTSR